jgi:predicted nucleic acid-binding protein
LSLVLDCSATLSFLLPDEAAPTGLLDRISNQGAWVPALWKLEVANALSVAVRRQRISIDIRNRLLRALGQFAIRIDGETDNRAWTEIQSLADQHNLTTYDAAYLELSVRRTLPLATRDAKLRAAALTIGPGLI